MSVIRTPDSYDCFVEGCEANDILFLDMGDAFLKEYEASYEVPYGFSNTSPNRASKPHRAPACSRGAL